MLYLNITSIHNSLNRLVLIPNGRISHSCWPLQAWKARKEDSGCFSLMTTSSRVFYHLLFCQWMFRVVLHFLFNLIGLGLSHIFIHNIFICFISPLIPENNTKWRINHSFHIIIIKFIKRFKFINYQNQKQAHLLTKN